MTIIWSLGIRYHLKYIVNIIISIGIHCHSKFIITIKLKLVVINFDQHVITLNSSSVGSHHRFHTLTWNWLSVWFFFHITKKSLSLGIDNPFQVSNPLLSFILSFEIHYYLEFTIMISLEICSKSFALSWNLFSISFHFDFVSIHWKFSDYVV